MSAAECEGVARAVHDETGIWAPVSAFELATACGLVCLPGGRGGGRLEHNVVRYDTSARAVRQHGMIAHEVGHYMLRLHAESDDEQAARYTAGALMLPRARFDRDLRETGWDLFELRRRHPNASAEMCARRIAQLRDAVVTVLDHGKVRARVGSLWLPPPPRMTVLEHELAADALRTGEVQVGGGLLAAYPLIEGAFRRVIVVAEAQQLSLRM